MFRQTKALFWSFLILSILFVSAEAQTTRVFVAESGSDANPCASDAPCKTITHALTVVDANGEVIIKESGNYDKFIVTKSVTVAAAPGVNAGIVSGIGYAVLIATAQSSDVVTIRNLILKGTGDGSNSVGVYNSSGAVFYIDGCIVSGFSAGISMLVGGRIFIHDTTVRNTLVGITVSVTAATGVIRALVDNCKLETSDTGLIVGSKAYTTVRNSVFANNKTRGILVRETMASQRAEAVIDNCQLSGNGIGLSVGGPDGASIAHLSRSTVSGNLLNGVSIATNGVVYSLQNNLIADNTFDVVGSLTPFPLK